MPDEVNSNGFGLTLAMKGLIYNAPGLAPGQIIQADGQAPAMPQQLGMIGQTIAPEGEES